jgi:hypothetical protein
MRALAASPAGQPCNRSGRGDALGRMNNNKDSGFIFFTGAATFLYFYHGKKRVLASAVSRVGPGQRPPVTQKPVCKDNHGDIT